MIQQTDEPRLSVTFRFYSNGKIKAVFLNADTAEDQETIEKALQKLLRTDSWIRALVKRCSR